MGACQCTKSHDCSAIWKTGFVFILSVVMLICYGSAYGVCEGVNWDDVDDADMNDFVYSDCRFSFFDKTMKFNGYSIFEGDVYVVYYIVIWCAITLIALISFLGLVCKCCVFLRRVFALCFFAGTVLLIISDVVSIGITFGNYADAMEIASGMKDDIRAARNTYLGMNCAILIMQTYILLNAMFDIAGVADMNENEDGDQGMTENEMVKNNQGVVA